MSWCEDNLLRPQKTSRRKATRAWRTMGLAGLVGKPDHKGGQRNLIAQVRPRPFLFPGEKETRRGGDLGHERPIAADWDCRCPDLPFSRYYSTLTMVP